MLTGSMTAAGKLMTISQPAVTRLIRDLEIELDLPLFRRSGTHISPTAEARQLHREVERYFSGVAHIREAARAIRELRTGHLRIGAMLTLSTGCLPRAVQAFLGRHPDVTVSIHSDSSLDIVEMVSHGQLDLGLSSIPADRADVAHTPLAAVEAVCVMPRGHRLARGKVIHVRDLDGEDFVSLGSSSLLRLRVEEALRATGVRPRIRLGTLYSSTVVGYVAAGLGLAITDPFAVLGPGRDQVEIRRFKPGLPFEFSAVYPPGDERSRLALQFVDILRQVVAADLRSLRLGLRNTAPDA
ncbi:LysR family transcriptional regulator [Rhodoplanes sp. TEM]|uniref:LysR family transcriptional regulator n=1 Tax=Rhodoplanes tepidamans TaxID=200616 RepID=A0ABT5JG14_RHOTP|nr:MULTISPECIES: LysR family transcriptional regulator [Rhodoplanes]MDC7788286.1 LysR family transcriptional regulator [Rhodoplanes tepidamans]MDC7987098.1 LysR family transcriptional regulator [Rhodoplanes sp. TEM]MDQ0355661.1 DNA-binding transcriptional LysR family regulator [Rhodoplanes tepidamans]